jgi:C_GCAxxG_C_C family probable redox protein
MTREDCEKYLLKGLDCGQTVLTLMAEELEISEEDAQRYASGFGGGMFTGDTCGAVVGAIMALGLKYGFSLPVNQSDKNNCQEKVLEFKRRFTEMRSSCICRELLGADISTAEGMAKIQSENLVATVCPDIIADAVTILEDIFDED